VRTAVAVAVPSAFVSDLCHERTAASRSPQVSTLVTREKMGWG
jgi:hypothetical protein